MWWLSNIVGYAHDTDKKRMNNNIQGTSMEVPEMVLLVKDHKEWDSSSNKPVPTRPVVSGSRGVNTHISEWLSEIMEPIASHIKSAEVCSTEEVLSKIDKINSFIEAGVDTTKMNVLTEISNTNKRERNAASASVTSNGNKSVEIISDSCNNDMSNVSLLSILDSLINSNEQGATQWPVSDSTDAVTMYIGGEEPTRPSCDNDYSPMGWGGMDAPSHVTTDRVDGYTDLSSGEGYHKKEESPVNSCDNDYSPTGWGGMNAPSHATTDGLMVPESGCNEEGLHNGSDYSPSGWGGMKAPSHAISVGGTNLNKPLVQPKIFEFFGDSTAAEKKTNSKENARMSRMKEVQISRKREAEAKRISNQRIHGLYRSGSMWTNIENIGLNHMKYPSEFEPPIQDYQETPVMIGADVCALYPSMDTVATAELAAESVRQSDIKFPGIYFKMLIIYVFLILGTEAFDEAGLSELIPIRQQIIEGKSDQNSKSLLSRYNRNCDNWYVDMEMITKENETELIAIMIKIATLVMMSSTCYTFGGLIYLQLDGAGIGLRGSAAQAKISMALWDQKWAEILSKSKFLAKLFVRYIDDIRIFCHPISKGWSWTMSGWVYNCESEDPRTPLDRTREELQKSFDAMFTFFEIYNRMSDGFFKWVPPYPGCGDESRQ